MSFSFQRQSFTAILSLVCSFASANADFFFTFESRPVGWLAIAFASTREARSVITRGKRFSTCLLLRLCGAGGRRKKVESKDESFLSGASPDSFGRRAVRASAVFHCGWLLWSLVESRKPKAESQKPRGKTRNISRGF